MFLSKDFSPLRPRIRCADSGVRRGKTDWRILLKQMQKGYNWSRNLLQGYISFPQEVRSHFRRPEVTQMARYG